MPKKFHREICQHEFVISPLPSPNIYPTLCADLAEILFRLSHLLNPVSDELLGGICWTVKQAVRACGNFMQKMSHIQRVG